MPCGPKSRMRPKTLRLPLMIFIRVAVCHAELVSNVEGDVEYEGAVFAAAHRKADEFDTVFFDDEREAQCLLVEVDGRVDFQIFLIEVDGNMVEFLDDHIAVHGGNRDLTAQRLAAEYRTGEDFDGASEEHDDESFIHDGFFIKDIGWLIEIIRVCAAAEDCNGWRER